MILFREEAQTLYFMSNSPLHQKTGVCSRQEEGYTLP